MREFRSHVTTAPKVRGTHGRQSGIGAEFLLQRFDIEYRPEKLFLARSVLDDGDGTPLGDLMTVRYSKIGCATIAQVFFAQFEVHCEFATHHVCILC